MKENVQRFSRFLSETVMPNVTVFTTWGLITALFIPTGWTPSETLAQMVMSVRHFPLPTLIAYTGDKIVCDMRGDVVGIAAAIGILAGTENPMFIGAMITDSLGGWSVEKVDGLFAGKTPAGFEALVSNFSTGIFGTLLAISGCLAIEPFCVGTKGVLVICVNFLVECSLLLLTSLFVEPAKILFLSNAISYGVLIPLGTDQVAGAGEPIFFLIEASPDPGLGLLLAYSFFGKGVIRSSTPSTVIIHFPGGIHEIYFPYVLMNPLTALVVITGGTSGAFINSIFNSDLASAASLGSIIAILGMCAKGSYIGVILSIIVAVTVPFVIATFILKFSNKNTDDNALEETGAAVSSTKNEAKSAKPTGTVNKIVFVCDAGMGSSAMGVITLIEKLNVVGMRVTVKHSALDDVPKDTQVIVMHKSLVERVEARCPNALTFPITNFTGGKEYDEIITRLTK